MTAPNPAVGALPGWRGTDPDGGTWVLTPYTAGAEPWITYDARGVCPGWRSQEEAEAAGLVPLVAETDETDQRIYAAWDQVAGHPAFKQCYDDPRPLIEAVMERLDRLASAPAAPAPLDPGNPEHLRQVAAFVGRFRFRLGAPTGAAISVRDDLNTEADRLDRERAEAEQAAADRKRAEEIAQERSHPVWWHMSEENQKARTEDILAGIRAERARQEAGQ